MGQLLQHRSEKLVRWGVMALCAGWILFAGWASVSSSQPVYNSYASPEQQLAKCRKLSSSQARYDCTSKIMLAQESSAFNQVMIVVLPPIALLFGYFAVINFLTARRERRERQTALAASRRRMEEWRSHMRKVKADAAAHATEVTSLRPVPRPIGTPIPLAKRQ
jgi:TRAP-type C4-dicarboxylate transport system permease small subunit